MNAGPEHSDFRLADLLTFVDRHGHLPASTAHELSCRDCDKGGSGRDLGTWYERVIAGDPRVKVAHETAVAVYQMADTVPAAARRGGSTEVRLIELQQFIERTGRLPRGKGRGVKAFLDEKSLYLWYRSVLHRKLRVSDDVVAAVERIADEHGRGLRKPAADSTAGRAGPALP